MFQLDGSDGCLTIQAVDLVCSHGYCSILYHICFCDSAEKWLITVSKKIEKWLIKPLIHNSWRRDVNLSLGLSTHIVSRANPIYVPSKYVD